MLKLNETDVHYQLLNRIKEGLQQKHSSLKIKLGQRFLRLSEPEDANFEESYLMSDGVPIVSYKQLHLREGSKSICALELDVETKLYNLYLSKNLSSEDLDLLRKEIGVFINGPESKSRLCNIFMQDKVSYESLRN